MILYSYAANDFGVQYIIDEKKAIKKSLFVYTPFFVALIFLVFISHFDSILAYYFFRLSILSVVCWLYYRVLITSSKVFTSTVKVISFEEECFNIETFASKLYKAKRVGLNYKEIKIERSISLSPELGEISIVTHNRIKYYLVKRFFVDYDKIVSALKQQQQSSL
ncbi:MAG: hypothetical protein KA149_05855 [Chitinophagales bacterium]|nr:hypothetical protein [Chitinophagales bacterium]